MPSPQEIVDTYFNPSDHDLLVATNELLAGYGRYVLVMANMHMRPVSMPKWTEAIIHIWENPSDDFFSIDWDMATRGLMFGKEYVWSYFTPDGHCRLCNEVDKPPYKPHIVTAETGRELWAIGNMEAGTGIVLSLTGLDWRMSLRRRPGT